MSTPATLPANFSGFDEDTQQASPAANSPQSLPADFNGFDEDKQQSPAADKSAPDFTSGRLAEHLNPAPPEAQPYSMPGGRMIDPMTHSGGIPNPHAVLPTATVAAAPSPSWIDRAKNYVADSQFGKNLHTLGQEAYGFLGGGAADQPADTPSSPGYTDPDRYVQQSSGENSPYKPIAGAKQIWQGTGNIATGAGFGGKSAMQLLNENPSLTPEEAVAESARQNSAGRSLSTVAKGATQVMGGGMEIAKPMIVYGVAAAPIKAAIYYGAGILAGKGSAQVAQELGATPDEVQFFNTAGFFIPGVLTGLAGLKTASIPEGATVIDPVTGENVPVRGGVAGGRGFAAGVARSDTGGYAGQVRVGPYSVGVKFGRNAPEAPGGPAQPQMEQGGPQGPAEPQSATAIQQRSQAATVAETAASAAAINLKAAQIVGMAPPPPPPPKPGEPGSKQAPPPAGIEQGHISQQVVDDLGKAITQLPPETQPLAIKAAVGKLAEVMFDAKTIVGPDMVPVNVDSQKAAQTEAINLIKGEVEKQQKAAQDAAKAKDEALQKQQDDAETAAQEREVARKEAEKNQPPPPIPDNPVTQAIRASLAKLPVTTPKADVIFAVRKAGAAVGRLIPEKLATQFYDEFNAKKAQQEDAASAGVTGEQVNHDQNPIALGRMANDVQQGKTAFLHVQPNSKFKPTGLTKETGFISTKVDKAQDPTFNGVYFHPAEIKSKDVKAAASGEAPLAHLRGLEAGWKTGKTVPETKPAIPETKAPVAETKLTGRAALEESENLEEELGASLVKKLDGYYLGKKYSADKDADFFKMFPTPESFLVSLPKYKNASHEEVKQVIEKYELMDALDEQSREKPVSSPSSQKEAGPVEKSNAEDAAQLYREAKAAALARGVDPNTTEEWGTAIAEEEARILAERKGESPATDETPTKFKYGNTQADIPADSEAGKAMAAVRRAFDKRDLAGDGIEEEPHITVRYGIDGEDTAGIRAYLEKQAPFEATLGKTAAFPASEHSNGAVPIIAPVESDDLRRMEKELDQHGTFVERSFPEYKPHATLAYVKPEAAHMYTGNPGTNGKKFLVKSVSISKKDGSIEEIPLKGQAPTKVEPQAKAPLSTMDRFKKSQQAKSDKFLDGPRRASDGAIVTPRQRMDQRLADGWKVEVEDVKDDAAIARIKREMEQMMRGHNGWGPPANENHPDRIKYNALKKQIADGPKTKQYSIADGKGDERIISKTEYDYAKSKEVAQSPTKQNEPVAPKVEEKQKPAEVVQAKGGGQPVGTNMYGTAKAILQEGISFGSQDHPMFYPDRGFDVYKQGSSWFYRNPEAKGMEGFFRASPEFGKTLDSAMKEPGDLLNERPQASTANAQPQEKPTATGLNTYEAEVSKYAGDPHPKTVQVQAENRRHAEQLLAEQHPGMKISSAGRVETTAPETKPVTFKPGDKVTVKQSDGTSKPDVVRFMSPTGKVILKGQRKSAAVNDVSPAEVKGSADRGGYTPQQITEYNEAYQRTFPENLDNAKLTLIPRDATSEPMLQVDHDAVMGINRVIGLETIYRGMTLPKSLVDQATERLRNLGFGKIASALDEARTTRGDLILISTLAKDSTIAEEQAHSIIYAHWDAFKKIIPEIIADPVFAKFRENLDANSYDREDQTQVANESLAKLASGQGPDFGISQEESHQYLSRFFEPLKENHGETDERRSIERAEGERQRGSQDGADARQSSGGVPSTDGTDEGLGDGKIRATGPGEGRPSYDLAAKHPAGPEYLSGGIGAVFSPELLKKAIANAPAPVHNLITGAQSEYANVRKSRSLQSGLYDLDSQATADVIRAKRFMESVPGDANDYEAIYHHIEDPKLPLTELQQKILDDYIRPLMASTSATVQEMRDAGAEADSTYVHRIVMDRGGFIDRLLAGSKSTGKGNVLKTKVPSQKSRTMMAVESPDGERFVVSIKSNRVTAFVDGQPVDLGGLRNGLGTKLEEISPRLDPIAKNILDTKAEIDGTHEAERQRQIESIEKQIERRQRDAGILSSVKGRVPGQYAAHGVEPSFGKRAGLTREIEGLEKQLDALKADTAPISAHETAALKRLNKRLAGLKEDREAILDSVPTEHLADEIWKDKTGKEWKITQATTKEIEDQTDLEYYHNALGSAIINWLAVEKQARAVRFLDALKASPDFPTVAVPIAGTTGAPEGWKTTQLAQLRSYYFEPHTAEVLDWYNDRLKAGDPGAYENINEFLVSSIFFNPMLHTPNIANHWFVEKGLSGWLDPRNKVSQFKAGLKAIDAVMHQNDDFLKALDVGAPMKSQQYEIRKFAQTFLDKMQQEIEADPTVWEKTAKALGYANPLKWLEGMKKVSSYVTWYSNDIAFLQAAYEKTAHGMDLRTALRETAKHIPDYRMPTRIFDSKQLQSFLGNKNIVMFMNYHYGAIKSYGETIKSILGIDGLGRGMGDEQPSGTDYSYENAKGEPVNEAGRTRDQERMHGLDILAALGFVTFVVYPLMIDKLLKMATGDKNAQARRAGASTVPYNLIQVAQGEKSPWDAIQSTVTPGVTAKLALEAAMNRDLRTGKQIYSWPPVDTKTFATQTGEKLAASFGPAAAVQGAHNFGTAKQLWGMAGVSFPQHGGERIAAEIAQAKAGSEALTPDAKKRMKAHYEALDALRAGDGKTAREKMNEAGLNAKQQDALRKEADADPLLARVKAFTMDELKTVYQYSTPEEKMRLGSFMRDKEEKEHRKNIGLGIKTAQ